MFRILVADDDKHVRRQLKTMLTKENYTVTLAENCEVALGVLDKEYIDLIILDVIMPKMDGYEFTKTLRDINNNLPILMLSAAKSVEDICKGFLAGADDYMAKPYDEQELLLRIKALLRRAQVISERKVRFGGITLDYDSMSVTRENLTEELPQKEFLLLYRLLSSPGKIFTRIQLMDEIWGSDTSSGWETVTVHIGRLRKRFKSWNEFEILSVRGVGYKAIKKQG